MFHIRWHKLYNYDHCTKYGAFNAEHNGDILQSLLKVIREISIIMILVSLKVYMIFGQASTITFHHNLQSNGKLRMSEL